ncbi:MAG: DNA repair protein RecO [Nitrospiraceae bacterium]|nr:DNA repair protein RecO [Nitrospiraceae bacterium]
MLRRTEGIVLRSRPFGEADLILEYLTKDYGIRSVLAKSPRKIKSRFGGSLEPFTHAAISMMGKEDAALPRLTQSDIIRPFQDLRENTAAFVNACEFAELALRLFPEREPCAPVFELLLWALAALEAPLKKNAGSLLPEAVAMAVFRIRALALAGYAPSLNGCTRCGKGSLRYYPRSGGVFCSSACAGIYDQANPHMELSPALPGLYASLGGWPLEKVPRIRPSAPLQNELERFISVHLRERVSPVVKRPGK